MVPIRATAPGKMILSGEYAVVFGHPGIAVPSPFTLSATWEGSPEPLTVHCEESERVSDYVKNIITECEKIAGKKFGGTLTIENAIPVGRGMGSSTALVIAITKALIGESAEKQAKAIEDIVNPGNSGLDFAVIWRAKPILFRKGDNAKAVDVDLGFLEQTVLIDTGAPGETTPELVAWMRERIAPGGLEAATLHDALAMIGQCTNALVDGEHPLTVFPDHHRAQLALGVVPEATHELILAIEEAGGAAKVLGAGARTGGGGMVLAVHMNPDEVLSIAKKHTMHVL